MPTNRRSALQIGRSSFVSAAIGDVFENLVVASSTSDLSESISTGSFGSIILVPPKVPTKEFYLNFQTIIDEVKSQTPVETHVILISSLICETHVRLEAKHEAYRAAKLKLEGEFLASLRDSAHEENATIIRLGMFMPKSIFRRAIAIRAAAFFARPFAAKDKVYRYTDLSSLQDAFVSHSNGSRGHQVSAFRSMSGLGMLRARSQWLLNLIDKLYV